MDGKKKEQINKDDIYKWKLSSGKDDYLPTFCLTYTTTSYRSMAKENEEEILESDRMIVEIGCSTGKCTSVLYDTLSSHSHKKGSKDEEENQDHHKECKRLIVALDISKQMIQMAKKEIKSKKGSCDESKVKVHLVKVDPFVSPNYVHQMVRSIYSSSCQNKEPQEYKENERKSIADVVFIDIGGNREGNSVLSLMLWVMEAFHPRLIVVKSEELYTDAHNFLKKNKENDIEISPDASLNSWWLELKKQRDNDIIVKNDSKNVDIVVQNKKRKTESSVSSISNESKQSCRIIPHPYKVPMVKNPVTQQVICRYHNYHKDGCKRYKQSLNQETPSSSSKSETKSSNHCPYDHVTCHNCLEAGHIARDCPKFHIIQR